MKKSKSAAEFVPSLPPGMAELLSEYRGHCANNGLRPGSIAQYEKLCGWFLHNPA
jgi:hypothetical protein